MREEEVTIEKKTSRKKKTIHMVDTHIIKGMKRTVDGWMDGRMDGWMDGRMDGRMDGWMHGWMDGRMDGWTDGRTLL